MPAKLVEKIEQLLESLVGYIDPGIAFFQLVDLEKAAVKVGHLAEQLFQVAVEFAFLCYFPKPVMEEPEKKVAIEGLEFILTLGLADQSQPVTKIFRVAVKKAFFLDEVHEHQAIEHERGVPLSGQPRPRCP